MKAGLSRCRSFLQGYGGASIQAAKLASDGAPAATVFLVGLVGIDGAFGARHKIVCDFAFMKLWRRELAALAFRFGVNSVLMQTSNLSNARGVSCLLSLINPPGADKPVQSRARIATMHADEARYRNPEPCSTAMIFPHHNPMHTSN